MKKLILLLLLLPSFALACSKHDSFESWFKKGLVKIEKDGTVTCNANALGEKNCTEAMLYIYKKKGKK